MKFSFPKHRKHLGILPRSGTRTFDEPAMFRQFYQVWWEGAVVGRMVLMDSFTEQFIINLSFIYLFIQCVLSKYHKRFIVNLLAASND